jgi:pimeloyl-ACP methyl ester carboxylesterase
MPHAKINGLNIYYEAAGNINAPPLVCLHGISSNSGVWRAQLAHFGADYRVIAWDARGYGRSDDPNAEFTMSQFADDLASLLDILHIPQAVIIGLSMGGVIAQEFYRRYADRVRALILADTNTGGGARPAEERHARLRARLKAMDELSPAEYARQRAPALLSTHAPPELVEEAIKMVAQIHPVGFRYAAIALDGADTRDVASNVRVPTLGLWGQHDNITPRAEIEGIMSQIPGAELHVIPGAGHLSNFEQPAKFNLPVRNFLRSIKD